MSYIHVLHPFSPHAIVLTSLAARGEQLNAFQKLPPGNCRTSPASSNSIRAAKISDEDNSQAVHNLVDVRGFIRFEQGENPSLVRAEWVVNWE